MKRIAVLMALLVILTSVAGCGKAPDNASSKQGQAVASGGQTPESAGTVPKADQVDYAQYQGDWTLKVGSDQELYRMTAMMEYMGSTGINFKEIRNGEVKGTIYSIQGAPSYRQAVVDFTGKITDGKLKTSYKDEAWMYQGSMELTFGKDAVEADITREKAEPMPMWGIPEGKFTFTRPIATDKVTLSAQEQEALEQFLRPAVNDAVKPFTEGSLTDAMLIHFVGYNLALGLIDAKGFGDKVTAGAEIVFEPSVVYDLAKKYFGAEVKNHQSVEFTTYTGGKYTVPALGGVTEYPQVQLLMKETAGKDNTYYALVNYMTENPAEGKKPAYQHLITLQKNNGYTIKAITAVQSPVNLN